MLIIAQSFCLSGAMPPRTASSSGRPVPRLEAELPDLDRPPALMTDAQQFIFSQLPTFARELRLLYQYSFDDKLVFAHLPLVLRVHKEWKKWFEQHRRRWVLGDRHGPIKVSRSLITSKHVGRRLHLAREASFS